MRTKTAKAKATLFLEGSWIHVRTPYHEMFIADLKTDIPYSSRQWDKVEKVWKVDPAYLDDLVDVCERYFDVNVVKTEPEVVMVQADGGADAYGRMLRLASPALVKKVYRMIAAELHPDRGGDADKMVELNQAWDEIRTSL